MFPASAFLSHRCKFKDYVICVILQPETKAFVEQRGFVIKKYCYYFSL